MKTRAFLAVTLTLSCAAVRFSQPRAYPKEIRGYKVERAAVELKSTTKKRKATKPGDNAATSSQDPSVPDPGAGTSPDPNVDQLITFGQPSLARVTPLGITFDVPVVVAPIRQSGHVDFLVFEDMTVNEHSIQIDEYHRAFDLPTKRALTLREPLHFFIYLPVVALAAVDKWSNAKETWPVTGRVYVCGKYKKFLFSFKRCVPVELNLTMNNPLKGR